MASLILVIALTAFLAGAATAVFLMLFTGIRKGDRPQRILEPRLRPRRNWKRHLAERAGLPR